MSIKSVKKSYWKTPPETCIMYNKSELLLMITHNLLYKPKLQVLTPGTYLIVCCVQLQIIWVLGNNILISFLVRYSDPVSIPMPWLMVMWILTLLPQCASIVYTASSYLCECINNYSETVCVWRFLRNLPTYKIFNTLCCVWVIQYLKYRNTS